MGRGNAKANYPGTSRDLSTKRYWKSQLLTDHTSLVTTTGNQRYREIIKLYRPSYVKSYRYEKRLVAQQVVTLVTNQGGRFLEEVATGKKGIKHSVYRTIKLERALEKIAQACREKASTVS